MGNAPTGEDGKATSRKLGGLESSQEARPMDKESSERERHRESPQGTRASQAPLCLPACLPACLHSHCRQEPHLLPTLPSLSLALCLSVSLSLPLHTLSGIATPTPPCASFLPSFSPAALLSMATPEGVSTPPRRDSRTSTLHFLHSSSNADPQSRMCT